MLQVRSRAIWDLMNTSYDKFIRTTDADHEAQVQKIFKRLYDQGDIYKGYYEGLYCTPCESFFTESQLVDGKCPDCGREVQPAKEEAYFFKMSKYADRLIAVHQRSSGVHPAGFQKERDDEQLPASGTSGSVCIQNLLQLGHSGFLRSKACYLCMAGCADQLYHRPWL